MSETTRKTIKLPEITRIEGHAAVHVDIEGGRVSRVEMQVFEGTRFFERIVLGHHFQEIPHITSRVCAICSTGHVLAAIFAVENIIGLVPTERLRLFRELMHLGMIIESHATHIFALALPDFVGARDLHDFATSHSQFFQAWMDLRALGAAIQTRIGGRPFHPVNLHVGGLSQYPEPESLGSLATMIEARKDQALAVCEFLLSVRPSVSRTTCPVFVALIPDRSDYGYFGGQVRSSEGWEAPVAQYKEYLQERTVPYSHAKRTTARGKDMMVGSMARLHLFGDRLNGIASQVYGRSALAAGDTNSIWNTLGQAIEVLQALDRAQEIIKLLGQADKSQETNPHHILPHGGASVGAIECPRGTLYHAYTLAADGTITAADMITPSVQNTGRIELDISEIVSGIADLSDPSLQTGLETLVRAYDPCNTCATHMVRINYC